jgi:hypothetical protein
VSNVLTEDGDSVSARLPVYQRESLEVAVNSPIFYFIGVGFLIFLAAMAKANRMDAETRQRRNASLLQAYQNAAQH